MAITGEPDDHQWGAPMTISGEISMAIDTQVRGTAGSQTRHALTVGW